MGGASQSGSQTSGSCRRWAGLCVVHRQGTHQAGRGTQNVVTCHFQARAVRGDVCLWCECKVRELQEVIGAEMQAGRTPAVLLQLHALQQRPIAVLP